MINLFSIVSKTHLANLQTVAESFNKYHRDVTYHVLLIDDAAGYCDLSKFKNFKFYYPEDICPEPDLKQIYTKYAAFHIACIFKSKFGLFLLQNVKLKTVIYMDTDLYFCGPITSFLSALKNYNALFTPHLCCLDMNENATKAELSQEAVVNSTGVYNLGFFGINNTEESKKFLQWWYTRTKAMCHREVHAGLFDDQKWLDPVHFLFEKMGAFKDLGYNVATWNLSERSVTKKNNAYLVNGSPLIFFHFSQAKPTQDLFLSDYVSLALKDYPAIRVLFETYRKHLLANKWEDFNELNFVKTIELDVS